MTKPVKNRRVKRMQISPTSKGGYSLIPHKNPNDPYSLPVSKGDILELKDALIWPPEITRNVYGKKMQEILQEHRDLLTNSTSLTPHEIIYKSIDLSGKFYTANKKFFEHETNKSSTSQQDPVKNPFTPPQQQTINATPPQPQTIKATPYAIKKTLLESKKKKIDNRRKIIKEIGEDAHLENLRKAYKERKKSAQSFYKHLRLASRVK